MEELWVIVWNADGEPYAPDERGLMFDEAIYLFRSEKAARYTARELSDRNSGYGGDVIAIRLSEFLKDKKGKK